MFHSHYWEGNGQLQEAISSLQCFNDAQPHFPRVEGGSRKTSVRFSCALVRNGSECVVTQCEWSLQQAEQRDTVSHVLSSPLPGFPGIAT